MWRYRVVKHKDKVPNGDDEEWYGIHEAYCDCQDSENKNCKPHSITNSSIAPQGETEDELIEDLEKMIRAFKYPILDAEDFK